MTRSQEVPRGLVTRAAVHAVGLDPESGVISEWLEVQYITL